MGSTPIAAATRLLGRIEDRLPTWPALRLLAFAVLAIDAALFGWALASGASIVGRNGMPAATDFSFIYAAGVLAASPHPASVYDYHAFAAVQAGMFQAPDGGLPHFHFLYPPTFLLITYPLASLPVFIAFTLWVGGTALLFLAALRIILPQSGILLTAVIAFAPLKNGQLGQNGFLTAGLLGLGLGLMERRPVAAGICLGLLTYKPHLGALLPLALVAGARWRVVAGAAVTALVLAGIASLLFGHDIWPAYFDSLRGFDHRLSPDQRVEFQYQSVFGWMQASGASATTAWLAHSAAAILTALAICVIWFGAAPYALKAAVLCIGVAAATPYVLTYDLCILIVALAFLGQDVLSRGIAPGDRLMLLAVFAGSLMLTRPVGPVVYGLLFIAVLWRLTVVPGESHPAAPAPFRSGRTRGSLPRPHCAAPGE